MRDCTQRDQLVREWNETVLKLSKAVSRLKACNGDNRNRFAKQFEETELTRQDAENAQEHDDGIEAGALPVTPIQAKK